MNDGPETDPLTPGLGERERKLFERAVRELQAHSVLADFDEDNADVTELFRWAEKNLPLLESYFRLAGLGIRAQSGVPVIQLVLEDDDQSHPLRQRLNKMETGVLIGLWILYHERMHEVDGFIVPVTVEEIYARLAALFGADKEVPETGFREAMQCFVRYRLVQVDWLPEDFPQSRVALLPTLLSTFRFRDPAEAQASLVPKRPASP